MIDGNSPAIGAKQIEGMLVGLQLPDEAPSAPQQSAPQQHAQYVPNVSSSAAIADDFTAELDLPKFGEQEEAPVEVQESAPVETPVDTPVDTPVEEDDLPTTPAADNFKKLRESVKAEREAKRQLEAQFTEARTKLEKYEKGEAVPDVMLAKDARIAELEKYEQIHSLETSRQYQEEIVKPAVELQGKLDKLADEYGVAKDILRQIAGLHSKKDQNNALSRYLGDIGGLEARKIIDDMNALGERAIEAKKAPKDALAQMQERFAQEEVKQKAQRAAAFETTARAAWDRALQKTRDEGEYKEFILHPTDIEYNRKVVEPIQQRAATQYGALIKQLADAGVTKLDQNLADGLARMVQLSIAGAMSLKDKARAENKLQDVMSSNGRRAGLMRPGIGSQNGSVHSRPGMNAPAAKGPQSFKEAGELALKNLR